MEYDSPVFLSVAFVYCCRFTPYFPARAGSPGGLFFFPSCHLFLRNPPRRKNFNDCVQGSLNFN